MLPAGLVTVHPLRWTTFTMGPHALPVSIQCPSVATDGAMFEQIPPYYKVGDHALATDAPAAPEVVPSRASCVKVARWLATMPETAPPAGPTPEGFGRVAPGLDLSALPPVSGDVMTMPRNSNGMRLGSDARREWRANLPVREGEERRIQATEEAFELYDKLEVKGERAKKKHEARKRSRANRAARREVEAADAPAAAAQAAEDAEQAAQAAHVLQLLQQQQQLQ